MKTRQQLMHRWERQRGIVGPIDRLVASTWALEHWTWIDRYCAWSVRRFGEQRGCNPWWDRVLGRFVCWVDDWRFALALRFGPAPRRNRDA